MAFNAPATSVALTALTAAFLNTYVRDNVAWMATDSPACRAYNNANISIPNNAITALTYNSERFDNAGLHSTSSNTGRLTVPSGGGGKYLFGQQIQWQAAAGSNSRRDHTVRLNGATSILQTQIDSVGSATTNHSISHVSVYALGAADYLDSTAYQDTGGAISTLSTSAVSQEFWTFWYRT